jgi:hypothetical protein
MAVAVAAAAVAGVREDALWVGDELAAAGGGAEVVRVPVMGGGRGGVSRIYGHPADRVNYR